MTLYKLLYSLYWRERKGGSEKERVKGEKWIFCVRVSHRRALKFHRAAGLGTSASTYHSRNKNVDSTNKKENSKEIYRRTRRVFRQLDVRQHRVVG